MALKIGQKISVRVEYLDADGSPTQELDAMPVFSLLDPSMGVLELADAFSGFYIPSKTGLNKLSVLAQDGGVDLLAEGEILVAGKDAVKVNLIFGEPEDVVPVV